MPAQPSRVYVVRIWREPSTDGDVWRASATDVRTQEKRYFKNRDDLNRFLEEVAPAPKSAAGVN